MPEAVLGLGAVRLSGDCSSANHCGEPHCGPKLTLPSAGGVFVTGAAGLSQRSNVECPSPWRCANSRRDKPLRSKRCAHSAYSCGVVRSRCHAPEQSDCIPPVNHTRRLPT